MNGDIFGDLPSGQRLHYMSNRLFFVAKLNLNMVIFNSYVKKYQRVLREDFDGIS